MKIVRIAISLSVICLFLSSCLKQQNDTPPSVSQVDPNLPVTMSEAALAQIAFGFPSATPYRVMGDTTVEGIVVADDHSGVLYHKIVINDAVGGLTILLSQANLYQTYPVGRKVYVKLKGLMLVNYHGLPEIGFSVTGSGSTITVAAIPSSFISSYIIPATYPNTVTPLKTKLTDLFSSPSKYASMLVSIDSMEFDSTAVGRTYAPSPLYATSGSNVKANVCSSTDNGSLTLYNSQAANFQAAIMPHGKGTLTGIVSIYNSVPEFYIRDSTDVQFTSPRVCP